MKTKRLALPKRFSVAMTESAYDRLRELNAEWHFGNNYLLTTLLENFDQLVDQECWQETMQTFIAEYGQPSNGKM